MRHKRVLFCILLSIFLLGHHAQMVIAQADISTVEAERTDPKLIITRDTKMQVFKAGEKVQFTVPITNLEEGQAKDVIVIPVIDDPADFPFEFEDANVKKQILYMGRRSQKDVVFDLKVKPNAEGKVHAIKIDITYSNLYGSNFNLSDTINVKIENDLKPPALKLFRIYMDGGQLVSGTSKTVELHLENTGDLNAKNIEARLSGFANDGLTLGSVSDTQEIKLLKAKHQDKVSFKIKADSGLGSGTQSVDLTLNYKDEYNKNYQMETKVYLPVEGSGNGNINFAFENLTYPQNKVETNSDFKISFDLKNTGESEAKGMKVSIDGGNEILPKSPPVINVNSLGSGEHRSLEFSLFAKEGVESKNYPVKISVEYENRNDKTNSTQTINQYVGILVNDPGSKSSVPKIIIENYDYDGEFVKAGETFPLEISFFNTHRGSAVRNVKVSLSADDGVFSPVGSSSSFYIEEIPANGRVEKTLMLKPKIDASYKTYNITADIEYEDSRGEKLNAKEVISIPVIQEVKLLISDAEIPTENFMGSSVGISMDFYNVGRALIRNLMIRTEGDFDVRDGSLYVGNLEAGKDDYYDVTIIPNKTGTLPGKVIFEYDNEIGEHYIIEKEFSIEAMEQPAPPMMDPAMEMTQPQKGLSKKSWIIAAIVVIGVCTGGILWFRRRKKKLEEVTIDE